MDADMAALYYGLGRAQRQPDDGEQTAQHLTGRLRLLPAGRRHVRAQSPSPRSTSSWYSPYGTDGASRWSAPCELVPPDSVEAGRLLCSQARYLSDNARRSTKPPEGTGEQSAGHRPPARRSRGWSCGRLCRQGGTPTAGGTSKGRPRRCARLSPCWQRWIARWDDCHIHYLASLRSMLAGEADAARSMRRAALAAAERLRDRHRSDDWPCCQSAACPLQRATGTTAREFSDRALAISPRYPDANCAAHAAGMRTGHTWSRPKPTCSACWRPTATPETSLAPRRGRSARAHRRLARIGALLPRSLARQASPTQMCGMGRTPQHRSAWPSGGRRTAMQRGRESSMATLHEVRYGRSTRSRCGVTPSMGIIAHAAGELDEGGGYFEETAGLSLARGLSAAISPGPAATMPTCCSTAKAPATRSAPWRCWTNRSRSPATWAWCR